MLDIKFIRENKELIKSVATKKNIKVDIDRLLLLDNERKILNQKIEDLRAEKNAISKKIPSMSSAEKEKILLQMKEVDALQTEIENKLTPISEEFERIMLDVPMYVDERTPIGVDDSQNVEILRFGEPRQFSFTPKNHMQLGVELDIIDNDRAVKIGGSRSYILKGDGARLEAAVIKYAEDFICRKRYTLMSVPVIVNREALVGTGYLPGAEEEIYHLQKDEKYLVGTSEVAIGSYYANEILDYKQLPMRLAGVSVCFRREAGSYGKDTHGLYRVHQFNKVEQFIIGENDLPKSQQYHEELLKNSQEILESLGLPYRVLNICTGDMGKGKYYMNDIETWMPSRNSYGETHSCSTLLDFQARRLNLRYRDEEGKIHFCYTLNNTAAATPRLLIAILENYQNEDGSITIPKVLRPYMDNQETIARA